MKEIPNSIRVVSAIADKTQVTLFLDTGEQLNIKQGDHRLGDLLDVIIPITSKQGIAVVSLSDFSIYASFEHSTGGLTKFFTMAKSKVKGFFSGKTDTHETHIPEKGKEAILRAVMGESMTEEEVLTHGKPMALTDDIPEGNVAVAVVTNPTTGEKKVIPGVGNLKPLIQNSVKNKSTANVQAFLNRCATFIDKRQHSVDDLMRFLEKGDLPLAEDGSIIAYKILNYKDEKNGIFVDCHTGKVQQRVGSYVCVNENLVDLNRRNECSNGLHIARRAYLRSFSGNLCVLCKIDPEDVMVVPHDDANKVRVKGYHILGVLSAEAKAALSKDKAMTGDIPALKMVYDAIKGNHIDRIERVQINGQHGNDVVITKIRGHKIMDQGNYDYTEADLKKAAAIDDEVAMNAPSVSPLEINKRVAEAMVQDEIVNLTEEDKEAVNEMHDTIVENLSAKTEPKKNTAIQDLLEEYHTSPDNTEKRKAAQAIIDYKKKVKKSWGNLGISFDLAAELTTPTSSGSAPEVIKEAVATHMTPDAKEPVVARNEKAGTKETVKPPANEEFIPSTGSLTISDRAREAFNRGLFTEVKSIKKKAKKSWFALGFSPKEIEKIEGK